MLTTKPFRLVNGNIPMIALFAAVCYFTLFVTIATTTTWACPHNQAGLILFSTLANWNQPQADIVISNQVKLDQSPGVQLRSIIIQKGGELIFDNVNLELNVEWIRVDAGGKFIAGSASCPITNKIVITFYGNRTSDNVIGTDPFDATAAGSKGLAAMSGSYIQLYGDVRRPTWTNLAQTIWKGNSTIKVMDATQWKVGDKLLITSTDYGELVDSRKASGPSWMFIYGVTFPDQNEERTILQVIDSKTFVLDRPLNFTHWGQDYARAEVGLLNRNIVLQGDASSVTSQFGGHFMIRVVEQAELSGIEVTRMGQKGLLGRYSVHWHVLADKPYSDRSKYFIKDSSIHHSFQRCVVVHDTNGLLIQDNVCFDSFGHQYFLEDGGEMGNEFIHNLGVRPRPVANADPLQIIPSDNDVACFWITNANNTWYHNAAVGGRFPYWFTMPLNVGGLSSAKYGTNNYYIRPRNQPLGGFKYNVAHSSNGNGFQVDDMLKADGTTELASFSPRMGPYPNPTVSQPSVDALFEGLISYKHRGYGIWARGGPLVFKNLTLFDNRNQMNSPPGPSVIMDSLFIAETDNVGEAGYRPTIDVGGRSRPDFYNNPTKFVIKGYETYDNGGPQILVNITFRNFMPNQYRQAGALGQLTDAPFKHQTMNRYVGLKFENSNHVYIMPNYFDGNKGACLLDIDGAATQLTPGGWIVSNDSILAHSGCIRKDEWRGYACPVSLEGYSQLAVVNIGGQFETTGTLGSDPQLNNPSARIPRMITHDLTRRVSSQVLGAVSSGTVDRIMHSNVIVKNFYAIRWVLNIPTPPVLRFSLPSSANNDWVVVSVQYPRTASLWIYYLKNGVPTNLTPVNSLSELVNDPTTYYYDSAGEHLYLYLRNRAGRTAFSERWGFSVYSHDGFNVYVNATCPNGKCTVDNYDLPKDSEKFIKVYNREDRFVGIMKPIVNGARGNGVAFATLLPNKRTVDFTVHHDLTLIATKMEIGIGDPAKGTEERFISQPGVKYTPYSVSRFSADLSVDELVHLLKGRLFVKLSTTENPNGHLKAYISCNQGKNPKGEVTCSLPIPIPTAKPCDPAPADSYNIYSESEDMDTAKTKWSWFVYNQTTDVQNGIYSFGTRNYTAAPICGSSSIYVGIGRGVTQISKQFSQSDSRTIHFIDLSVYKYFEFFVKAITPGELRLNIYFTEIQNNAAKDGPSMYVDPKYIQHYKIDETRVTRVRIPVVDYPFTNKTSLNAIQRIQWAVNGGTFKEFMIDQVRFVKGSMDDPIAVVDGMTQADVVGFSESVQNPDTDPLGLRPYEQVSIPPATPSRSSSSSLGPKTSSSTKRQVSAAVANSWQKSVVIMMMMIIFISMVML